MASSTGWEEVRKGPPGPQREHCPASILILDFCPLPLAESTASQFPAHRTIKQSQRRALQTALATHSPARAHTSNTPGWSQRLGHVAPRQELLRKSQEAHRSHTLPSARASPWHRRLQTKPSPCGRLHVTHSTTSPCLLVFLSLPFISKKFR